VDFYNGKGIRPLKSGKYPVYGSNGILGFTNEFLYENAIVLGRVGAYCGSVQIEKDKFWPSDNTIVLKPKDHIDIDYLYYYLKSLDLNRVSGGSAQPLITHTSLAKVQIEVPLKDVQTSNSGVLKIIDTLIEHHKLINSNLEAILSFSSGVLSEVLMYAFLWLVWGLPSFSPPLTSSSSTLLAISAFSCCCSSDMEAGLIGKSCCEQIEEGGAWVLSN
jgi:hypothetical protein